MREAQACSNGVHPGAGVMFNKGRGDLFLGTKNVDCTASAHL